MCTVLDCTPLYIVQNHNWPHYWITIYWINTQFCTVQYNTVQYSIMQNKIKSNLVIEQASDLNTIIFFHKSSLKKISSKNCYISQSSFLSNAILHKIFCEYILQKNLNNMALKRHAFKLRSVWRQPVYSKGVGRKKEEKRVFKFTLYEG